jgi:hydrogenase-4 component J
MAEKVVIYALNRKFVNQEKDIPETARQVIYYSLAIGHHVGVIDCLQSLAEIPLVDFTGWLERLPEGPARQKLAGILTWGEIEVNRQHVAELAPVLQPVLGGDPAAGFAAALLQALRAMTEEPALYLMIRRRPE